MGRLVLPSSGFIYADTDTVIYSIETQAQYWSLLRPLWEAAKAGSLAIVTSELTLLETLVGPLRSADRLLLTAYEQLFQSPEIRLVPISKDILREGARLRAVIPGLRTPDALHAATAALNRCTMFLSNDTGFRRVPDLPITILDEVLKTP